MTVGCVAVLKSLHISYIKLRYAISFLSGHPTQLPSSVNHVVLEDRKVNCSFLAVYMRRHILSRSAWKSDEKDKSLADWLTSSKNGDLTQNEAKEAAEGSKRIRRGCIWRMMSSP